MFLFYLLISKKNSLKSRKLRRTVYIIVVFLCIRLIFFQDMLFHPLLKLNRQHHIYVSVFCNFDYQNSPISAFIGPSSTVFTDAIIEATILPCLSCLVRSTFVDTTYKSKCYYSLYCWATVQFFICISCSFILEQYFSIPHLNFSIFWFLILTE